MSDAFDFLDEEIELKVDELQVTNPAEATFVYEQIKRLKEKLAEEEQRIKDYLDMQHERAMRHLTSKREQIERQLFPLEGLLKGYIQMRKEADPKYSFSCQFGSAYIKKGDTRWVWPDNKTIIAQLTKDGKSHLMRIKREPDKTKIREEYSAINGGIPTDALGFKLEGVEFEDMPDKMVFKFKEDDKEAA